MKSILLHIQEDAGFEARFQCALDIVRASDGHLTCLHATTANAYVGFDMFGGAFVTGDLLKRLDEYEEALRSRIEARLAREDVASNYLQISADPAQALVDHGALSDLIVLSHPPQGKTDPVSNWLIGDVLMATRTPILVVPDTAKAFNTKGTAVIAWNGSFEAANALRAALPMLRHATAVHVVTVDEAGEKRFPSITASQYMSRHGIASELQSQPRDAQAINDILASQARAVRASYLVMGAYGHSRAREYLFGGVTRGMLSGAAVPLLLAR